ncbi:MAG: hypothetical protein NDI63_06205 [Pseudobdellovibrio sp.]|nr:hypothetical protein [Pseudobdellovibrio sp.]
MKYAYATMIVLCLLASTSWSASNPLIRNCNLAGGEFTVVEIQKNSDQWALCKFDNAYVGAFDVMQFNTKEGNPISFNEYSTEATQCSGHVEVAQVIGTDKKFLVCQYADSSFIDLITLSLGVNAPENFQLNKFLGL